ncbi:uncharacterized protein B0H18DRAFT_1117213, partial [Fomitopsis serialis]
KHEYEHIADTKRQEHPQVFPGYKFQPVKKEDKEKRKEEEKAEKARVKEELKKAKSRHVPYVQQDLFVPGPPPQLPQPPFVHLNHPYRPALSTTLGRLVADLDAQSLVCRWRLPGGGRRAGREDVLPWTSVMLPPTEKRPRAGKGKQPAYDSRMPPPLVPSKV